LLRFLSLFNDKPTGTPRQINTSGITKIGNMQKAITKTKTTGIIIPIKVEEELDADSDPY